MDIKQTFAVWYLLGPSLQCARQQFLGLLFAVLVNLLTLSYSEHRRLLQGANKDGTSICNSTSVHVIPSTKKVMGHIKKSQVPSPGQAMATPRLSRVQEVCIDIQPCILNSQAACTPPGVQSQC